MKRQLYIGAVRNCRDLGGLPVPGGAVKRGRLIRSACLADIPQADVEALAKQTRLSLVIDLRTGDEISQKPETLPAGVAWRHMPIFDAAKVGITHEKGKKWDPERPTDVKPDMPALYRMMVGREDCRRAFSETLTAIMAHDFSAGSVLWHCSEGKDRCGLVAALLLAALGASREVIMDDYLLTNETAEARAEGVYRKLIAAGRGEADAAMMRDLFMAKREYMDAALDVVDRDFGGLDGYLREGLGLSDSLLAGFRDRMTERF